MTEPEITALEAQLSDMSDQEVLAFYQSLEVEDERVDVTAGEIERRNLDI